MAVTSVNWFIWIYIILANIIMLAAGLITKWLPKIESQDANTSWYMQILYPLAALVNSIIVGVECKYLGRRMAISSQGLYFAVAFLIIAFPNESETAEFFAHFFGGAATGGILVALSVYIVEVAETKDRGKFGAVISTFYFLGYALIALIAYFESLTYIVSIVCLVFIVCSTIALIVVIPETPQHLILNQCLEESKVTLRKLRRTQQIDDEFEEIKNMTLITSNKSELNAITLFVFRGLSGVDIALYYAIQLHNRSTSVWYDELELFMQFLPLIASLLLCFTDSIGRKSVLILSALGTFIAEIILAVFIEEENVENTGGLCILSMILLRCCYSLGVATFPWFVVAELQPCHKRPLVLGAAASLTWLLDFIITGYYFTIVNTLGSAVFLLFPIVNLFAVAYYYFILPETSNRSDKDISEVMFMI